MFWFFLYICGVKLLLLKNMKGKNKTEMLVLMSLALCGVAGAQTSQDMQKRDSVVTVGYASGKAGALSGTVDKIEETQMNNKDHVTNALDAIRGRVAGLTIQRNGANALNAVRLRGTTSLTGANDPLIIVDGVMGGLSLLESIYPTDIQSFTILKDASETAQYGSRGAAGVIEVTTQKGEAGSTRVIYNGSVGFSSVYKRLDMLDAGAWRSLSASRGISILDYGNNTNFQKEIEQTGFMQQHHVAFYGGSEQSNYRVSLGYVSDDGIIRTEWNRSFIANMNMSQDMFDGFLKVEIGLFGSTAKRHSLFDVQKTLYSAAAWNPTFPNHQNESGNWDGMSSASQINNPFALLEEKNHDASAHISTHAKLLLNLLPDLKLTVFGAYTYNNDNLSQYLPTIVWNKGQAYQSTDRSEMLLGNVMLSFKKQMGRHAIDAIALAEVQRETFQGYHVTVTNFSTNLYGYDNLSAGALRPWGGTGSYYEDPRMTSYMGRLNYAFNDRYIATIVARADGSSKFGSNHKWGFFPSVSGAWVVSREKFMQHQHLINDLKVNIGYGLAGSQDGIDSYTTLSLVKPNGVTPAGSATNVSLGTLRNVNPDLKWEVKKNFNVGLDMSLLDGRLLFTANYYNSKTEDMLYPYSVSVPPFTYNVLVANIGSMRNSGLELSIGVIPLETKDMELDINANVTFQKNKLLSLSGYYGSQYLSAPAFQTIAGLNGAGFHGGYNNVTYQIVGQSLGVFYLPECTGLVSDGKGGYTYGVADLNGGGVDMEDGQDRYIAGQAEPKVLLGSNISFRYKDFDVSVQMNGAFGHKIYNGTSLAYMNMSSFPLYNVLSKAPAANIADQTVTDYWLENGDYLNIDYITLGWRVPLRSSKIARSLRLSLTMNNVATFTNYSGLTPMINSSSVDSTFGVDDKRSYPLYHTYTFAVSINF